jgi:hypothetical protein
VVTYRLDVDQFRRLLIVVMADDVADHLSNAVLMACTRPQGGIISVPLRRTDGVDLADIVDRAAVTKTDYADLAEVIRAQLGTASPST